MNKLTHTYESGNDMEITIPDNIQVADYNAILVAWERFSPSAADIQEYNKRSMAKSRHARCSHVGEQNYRTNKRGSDRARRRCIHPRGQLHGRSRSAVK